MKIFEKSCKETSQLSNAVFEIFIRPLEEKTPAFYEKRCQKDREINLLTGASLLLEDFEKFLAQEHFENLRFWF